VSDPLRSKHARCLNRSGDRRGPNARPLQRLPILRRPYDHVRLFSPDGRFVTSFTVQDHGDERGYVSSIAVGWATRYGPTGIELRDPSGDLIRSIDTGLFFPDDVDFASDHSFWAFGIQRAAPHSQVHPKDYSTLRHYSPAGNEIGAYLPRSKFPHGLEPGTAQWQERRIYVMPDFIGLMAFSGNTGEQQEWVEVDLAGNIRGRWRLDGMPFPMVSLTSDGNVYAKRRDPKTQWTRLWCGSIATSGAAKSRCIPACPFDLSRRLTLGGSLCFPISNTPYAP
jgi:hypothetical protein